VPNSAAEAAAADLAAEFSRNAAEFVKKFLHIPYSKAWNNFRK